MIRKQPVLQREFSLETVYAYVGGNPLSLIDPLGLEGVGPWTFPAGPVRDTYNAAKQGNITLNFELHLGGTIGYYILGGAGEAGFTGDTNGRMCFYTKGCGASPIAGGFIGGASVQGGAACGIGELQSGTQDSVEAQVSAFDGPGLKGSVEADRSGVSAGLDGGFGWQVSGGLHVCKARHWCTK